MLKSATFDADRKYRFTLTRSWDDAGKICVFCGLNPSTADETEDDPTIRREINFARDWGYGTLVKVNAYAFRATKPTDLWTAADPVGPDNLNTVAWWGRNCDLFVAAWGTNIEPAHADAVVTLLQSGGTAIHALRMGRHGQPWHTLYLPKASTPVRWK